MRNSFYRLQTRSFGFLKSDYQSNMSNLLHSTEMKNAKFSSQCPISHKKVNFNIFGLPIQPLNNDDIRNSGNLSESEKQKIFKGHHEIPQGNVSIPVGHIFES